MRRFRQQMRIAIAYNKVDETGAPDERDVLDQVATVSEALAALGHQTVQLPCDLDLSIFQLQIASYRPDMVFNLVESLNGHGRLISVGPSLLDALGLPYSGAPAGAILETSHKILSKERMRQAGLPTPPWLGPWPLESCTRSTLPCKIAWLRGPWIIKSVWEHASLGLDANSLVFADSPKEVMEILERRAPELGRSCFAEPYIEGREFNLSLLAGPDGPQVLPPAEILFENFEKDRPRIVCYKAKWEEDSFEYAHTSRRFAFSKTDTAILDALCETARRCWHVFSLRGYARVDFRVDGDGRPWILEINANPCLSPDAGFAAAVEQAGLRFSQAVERILADAVSWEQKFGANPSAPCVPKPRNRSVFSEPKPSDVLFRYEPNQGDVQAIRDMVESTGFFHSYEIDVAVELVEDRLTKGKDSDYHFVFLEKNGSLAGYVCYGRIPCTSHSFDLYWIVVHPDFQNQGLGRVLAQEAERLAAAAGGKRMYIETSQSEAYAPTREFYRRLGYRLEAMLPDFYGPGDGKRIECKTIA